MHSLTKLNIMSSSNCNTRRIVDQSDFRIFSVYVRNVLRLGLQKTNETKFSERIPVFQREKSWYLSNYLLPRFADSYLHSELLAGDIHTVNTVLQVIKVIHH